MMMSRFVTLVLFLFTLFLTITVTAQDTTTPTPTSTSTSTPDPSSTPAPTPTPTSSSSSTGTISNGTNTNTTVPPTATATTTPTTATGRAVCPGNDAFTEALKNDLPPWNCPRLDVDGGALGPRNNYDPCHSLTKRLTTQRETPVPETAIDYVCTQAPVAGLNSSTVYSNTRSGEYRVPSLVTKGEVYPVAIVTSNVLFNKKMIFQPVVDSFTSLEIAASHGVQWFSVPNTFISLEAGGLTSGPRSRIFRIPALNQRGYGTDKETMAQNYWQNPTPGGEWLGKNYGIVPFWTVLINVDNGRITSINWDEGCDACADQLCSPDGNCGVDEYSCAIINGTTTLINGKITRSTATLPEYDIRTLSDCARNASRDFNIYTKNMTSWDPTNYTHIRAAADSCIAQRQVLNSIQVASGKQPAALSVIQEEKQKQPGNTDCGIKIYLGWTGTDQNGKFFTSAGKRLSVFRKYSIGAAFNSASQYVEQQLPEAPVDPDAQP